MNSTAQNCLSSPTNKIFQMPCLSLRLLINSGYILSVIVAGIFRVLLLYLAMDCTKVLNGYPRISPIRHHTDTEPSFCRKRRLDSLSFMAAMTPTVNLFEHFCSQTMGMYMHIYVHIYIYIWVYTRLCVCV